MAPDFKKFPELVGLNLDLYYHMSPHYQIFEDFEAVCTKVSDGDTMRVKGGGRDFEFPVRFLDIAAPELSEPGGQESKEWLRNQVEGKNLTITVRKSNRVGKYGRLLGKIYLEGKNVGEMSMREGHSIKFGSTDPHGAIIGFDKIVRRAVPNAAI